MSIKKRRTNRDIDRFYSPLQIYDLIIRGNPEIQIQSELLDPKIVSRNRALMSLEFMSCGRVSEVLKLRKDQFIPGKKAFEFYTFPTDIKVKNPDSWILIKDFMVLKRKEKTLKRFGQKIIDIPLAVEGNELFPELIPLTGLILEYLARLEEGERLFNFKRNWALKLVDSLSGKWNHWFRAQALSYYVNKLDNPYTVCQIFGIENVQTILWYYKGAWVKFMGSLKS